MRDSRPVALANAPCSRAAVMADRMHPQHLAAMRADVESSCTESRTDSWS